MFNCLKMDPNERPKAMELRRHLESCMSIDLTTDQLDQSISYYIQT